VRAYSWAFAYLIVITFDMIYIKHVVMHIGLPTWGLVYYNNLTAFLLSPPVLYGMGEFRDVVAQDSEAWWLQLPPILLSCLFGVAISYFGFACRQALSPTAFTVLGVMNKLITVLVNITIWDKHASVTGIGSLLLCIVGGVLYERAVKKEKVSVPSAFCCSAFTGGSFTWRVPSAFCPRFLFGGVFYVETARLPSFVYHLLSVSWLLWKFLDFSGGDVGI
jgi:multidrug transporter EmrE-like cation transporter